MESRGILTNFFTGLKKRFHSAANLYHTVKRSQYPFSGHSCITGKCAKMQVTFIREFEDESAELSTSKQPYVIL